MLASIHIGAKSLRLRCGKGKVQVEDAAMTVDVPIHLEVEDAEEAGAAVVDVAVDVAVDVVIVANRAVNEANPAENVDKPPFLPK